MPKKSVPFISAFLIPSLNAERFGENLKWLDKENTIFQMEWCHKGGPTWTKNQAVVFSEWDKKRGHYQPSDENYYTKSKQRFRSLLYKLTKQGYLKDMKSEEKFKKVYCIVHEKKIKRDHSSCESSESEFSNEGHCSSKEIDDSNEIYRRMISDDEITNILEDHAYCTDHMQNTNSDSEKEQEISDCVYVQKVPTSIYETLKYAEKNVLAEINNLYEEIIQRPAVVTDGNYMYCTLQNVMTCDEEIISDVPFLQMSEFLSGNYSSLFSFDLNKPSEGKSDDFEIKPTVNVNMADNDNDALEALDCIPDIKNMDTGTGWMD